LSPRPQTGIRVIVAYKLVKAAVQLALAPGVYLLSRTAADRLHAFAERLCEEAVSPPALRLAHALLRVSSPRFLAVVAVALVVDGVISLVEGWALHRRLWFAEWMIVVATAGLLPLELTALVRHPHPGHALVVAANLAIVVYLVYRRARHLPPAPTPP
jgi:uncharacterized membrane protein (DUF2068 family)